MKKKQFFFLQKRTGAVIYLNYKSKKIRLLGTQTQVSKAMKEIERLLSGVTFVELGSHASVFVGANAHRFHAFRKKFEGMNLFINDNGRLALVGSDKNIQNQCMQAIQNEINVIIVIKIQKKRRFGFHKNKKGQKRKDTKNE